ncbi:MAG: hypothetical protein WBO35_02720 [Candidatus Saccharimonadales bacterium]|jgi:hypothetical protein
MKNQPQPNQPNSNKTPVAGATERRTYKPRTPITRIHKQIMSDPFIFTI